MREKIEEAGERTKATGKRSRRERWDEAKEREREKTEEEGHSKRE